MSGICGIIYFDGQTVASEFDALKDILRHRGPDKISIFKEDHIAFAHLKLNIFKNDLDTGLVENNKQIIVADARIDNRKELINVLKLAENSTNTELILAAYQKWNDDLVFHLIGDFAFVIYDKLKQKVICGRDCAACRPLYYVYEPQKYFAFASEIKALLALPYVNKAINEHKVLRYLEWGSAQRPYRSETFYKQVKSLPPAHCLVADKTNISSRLCWDLNLERFAHLKSDEDFVEAFKETFIEAVRCRTQTDFGISAHLSGGLDSSSICAVASKILNQTVHTLHFDVGPTADEKMYAEEVLKMDGFKHLYVKARPELMGAIDEMTAIFSRPDHFTVIPTFHLANAEAVQKNGSRILLTGHDGDSVVGFGRAYPLLLFKEQKWKEFRATMESYARVADLSDGWPEWNSYSLNERYQWLLEFYVKPEIIKLFRQKQYGNALMLWLKSTFKIGYKSRGILESVSDKFFKKRRIENVKATFQFENDYGFGDELNEKAADILHEGMYEATEQFEQISAAYGHETAHPFYDKRLIELCLVVPDKLKFDDGYRRGTLRKAMIDVLPETVRLRTSKVHFDHVISDELRANAKALELILKNIEPDNEHIAKKIKFAQNWLYDTADQKPIHCLRTFYWAIWKSKK